MKIKTLIGLLCILLVAAACSDDGGSSGSSDESTSRTVLVYMVAENSLAYYAYDDIAEMLQGKGALTDNDRLIVYVDNTVLPRIFEIRNSTKGSKMTELSPLKTYTTDLNSASAETLSEVVSYVLKKYPADEYGLVFWSHSSGWVPSTYSAEQQQVKPRKSFGIDNGKNTQSDEGWQLEISDLASALGQFPKFRFIFFDACFMQSAEVAYELRNCAEELVASPAEIPGSGAPYQKILRPMFADEFDAEGLAKAYCDYYRGTDLGATISVVDCSGMDAMAANMKALLASYADSLQRADYEGVLNYYPYDSIQSQPALPDMYDIQGLARLVLSESQYQAWLAAYDKTVRRYATDSWFCYYLNRAISVDRDQYGGMSMFLPLAKYKEKGETFYDAYFQTSWGRQVYPQN